MAPTLALDGDGPALAIGSAGGTRLRTALVGVAAAILDEGLDPAAAVERPRFHPAGALVNAEPGVDEDALERARGGRAAPCGAGRPCTTTSAVSASSRGAGAAGDPRRSGAARGAVRRPRRCQRGPDGGARRARRRGAICSIELRLALEHRLVAQPLPELDDEPPAVEVALEVEQERLDPPLARRRSAGSCRSRSPRGVPSVAPA